MPDAIDELVDWQLKHYSYNPWDREIFEDLPLPSSEGTPNDAARWIPGKGWTNKL
jgi:hypothetical protein